MPTSLPRPAGHHVVVPSAVVPRAAAVIGFLERAFGGNVVDRYDGPGGAVMHAEVLLGDSVLMLGEPTPDQPAAPAILSYYVDDGADVEATYPDVLERGVRPTTSPGTEAVAYGQA